MAVPPSDRRLRSGSPPRLVGGRPTTQASTRRRRPHRSGRQAAFRRLAADAARTPPFAQAARVRAFLPLWTAPGAAPWVLRVLKYGYKIPWSQRPPPRRCPAYPQSPADLRLGHATADSWVASGFVYELSTAEAAAAVHVAPTFVVKHPKDRLVADLSATNAAMQDRPFAYDNLPRYAAQLSPGDNLFSWDILEASFHVPLAPVDQRRLAFRVGGRVLVPLVLPLGMKLSPYAFTKVLRPVVGELRSRGLAVLAYMDDFCGRPSGPSPSTADAPTASRVRVMAFFSSLGLAVHPSSGAVTGTTALPILGYVLDTVRRLLLLPPSRLDVLLAAAGALLAAACSSARRVPFKSLPRFTGKAVSCHFAVPAGRFHLGRLYAAQKGHSRSRLVSRAHGAIRDLIWGRQLRLGSIVGRALWRPPLGLLTTDASQYGWGRTWNGLVPARGFFSAVDRPSHINVKEVAAVRLSLLSLHAHFPIRDGELTLRIDNRVAMACINNFFSRSPRLSAELHKLHALCRSLWLSIRVSWIASVANEWADRQSRDRDRTDWQLHPALFRRLLARYGAQSVDLFASSLNTHCPRFDSLPASPGCDAIDGFAQVWSTGNLWANPPFSKIALVLAKIVAEAMTVTLILPVWQAQAWWSEAVGRANEALLLSAAPAFSRRAAPSGRRQTRTGAPLLSAS